LDLGRLADNIAVSWRHRASFPDFVRSLLFTYAQNLPSVVQKRDWIIGFTYPAPVGKVRLALRANQGADGFIRSEVFDRQYYRLPLGFSPPTILDLGANIGLTSIYLARAFPQAALACVEPMAGNLRVLARNLQLNGIHATIIAAAAHVEDGRVQMTSAAADYDHKIAVDSGTPSGLEVAAISVPAIMRKLNWDRIGLLKMDVEGHEKFLLTENCDWLECIDAMCVEYHHDGGEIELARLASRYGFSAPRRLPGEIWFLTRQRPVN
jgi:FkbM family methyltransferase